MSVNGETSSPVGTTGFARNVPRSFLNRPPSFDGPVAADSEADADAEAGTGEGEVTLFCGIGIVSTLVEAHLSCGREIWLTSMRFLGAICGCSGRCGLDGLLLIMAIATSARRCTSIASSMGLPRGRAGEDAEGDTEP